MIHILAGVTVDISGLTIRNGFVSGGAGGGVFNEGTLTLNASTVRDNGAKIGAGIASSGDLTLNGSTISGNATGGGSATGPVVNPVGAGGIENINGTATLTNSTVSGNSGDFGGIFNGGTMTLTNVTLKENAGGPSLANSGTVTLKNTILGFNGCSGTIISAGNNLAESPSETCDLSGPGDISNNPLLLTGGTFDLIGPLADNGGPTQTHALLRCGIEASLDSRPCSFDGMNGRRAQFRSPAIDAGDAAACPATDQRGEARPVDGDGDGGAVCDIGAYEAPEGPTPAPAPAGLPVGGGAPTSGGSGQTLAIVLLAAVALGLAGVGGALVGLSRRC